MRNNKKKSIGGTILFIATGAALTVAGFVLIPPLLQKYSNKVYKTSLKRENIDFDNMGPEIIPYVQKKEEE